MGPVVERKANPRQQPLEVWLVMLRLELEEARGCFAALCACCPLL